MLPSPRNGSDCICPIFGAENKCTQCSEWLTCCVTSFGQVLYWRQILNCDCAQAFLLDYWVLCAQCPCCSLLCVCPATALLSVNSLPERWEHSRHDLSLYYLSNTDFLCSYLKEVWSQTKSRLSLVQAWILWGFIYWSFLPWMVFSIVLHYFVALDTLPLVMLTSVPCFHGWLGLTKSFEMFVLFFHWCCLFKDLSPMSMVVASGQKPQCALMDYSSWIRWGMSQLLINQPIQTPGFIPSLTHAKTFIRLHEIGTVLKQGQGYCLAVLLLEWAGGLCFLFF